MRMRRLPWAEEYLNQSEIVIKDPEKMKGRWRQLVKGEKLHLEIGCGKGDYWNLMAQKEEQDGWIAIERNVSVAGIAVRKFDAMHNDPARMRFIWGDAEKVDEWFGEGEIDIIHLNFSDPWPKKRHAKRRLSSPDFLKEYDSIFREKKEIIMKTDNRKLFEYSILSMTDYGYHIREISLDLYQDQKEEHVQTEYEIKFHNLGYPIYWMCVDKN